MLFIRGYVKLHFFLTTREKVQIENELLFWNVKKKGTALDSPHF